MSPGFVPRHGVTVNVPELVVLPPGVVIPIFPVFAPLGTVAVTCVSEFTVNGAATPPKVTFVVWLRLTPVIVTGVPTGPLVGLKLVICGMTRNFFRLDNLPPGVVTVTTPVFAPAGTVAVKYVSDTTWKLADVPPKETLLAPVNP